MAIIIVILFWVIEYCNVAILHLELETLLQLPKCLKLIQVVICGFCKSLKCFLLEHRHLEKISCSKVSMKILQMHRSCSICVLQLFYDNWISFFLWICCFVSNNCMIRWWLSYYTCFDYLNVIINLCQCLQLLKLDIEFIKIQHKSTKNNRINP